MFSIGRVHVFSVEMVYLVLKECVFHSRVSYIDRDIQFNLLSTYVHMYLEVGTKPVLLIRGTYILSLLVDIAYMS